MVNEINLLKERLEIEQYIRKEKTNRRRAVQDSIVKKVQVGI